MPPLSEQASAPFIKMMLIGHSGAGKTGALTSLVKAGYKVRILDLDHNLSSLINHVRLECPDKMANVDYMSFRDKYKATPSGPAVVGPAKAFTKASLALDKWEDGSDPSEWGHNTVLVIDTLTSLGRAAHAKAKSMNPQAKEPRTWYYAAQDDLENILAVVTDENFKTNVIVNSHIDLVTQADGSVAGFATTIGKALGPKVPRYFPTLVALEIKGIGTNVKRILRTVPTSLLTLKTPAPASVVEAEYPIETGLATLFSKLSGKS